MISLRINDCDISLLDDYDPELYRLFFDQFIATSFCVHADVYVDRVIATLHYDENDDPCSLNHPAYTYDDTNLYRYDDELRYFYMC
jgi:hypothetical protein